MITPTWYFHRERLEALDTAAARWLGTPFRENSAVPGPGGGVSCHNLLAEVYFETGCMVRFPVPRGRARALTNRHAAEFLAAFDAATAHRLGPVDPAAEEPRPGDALILCDVRGLRHLGLALPRHEYLHVGADTGVMRSPLAEASARIIAIRRPLP
jgi:hypothetical protein